MLLGAVHVEAALIVTGSTNCAVLKHYLRDLVENRSKPEIISINLSQHKLITVYQSMHGLAPNYLSDLLHPIGKKNRTMLSEMLIIYTRVSQK